jgi:hypothetical protein
MGGRMYRSIFSFPSSRDSPFMSHSKTKGIEMWGKRCPTWSPLAHVRKWMGEYEELGGRWRASSEVFSALMSSLQCSLLPSHDIPSSNNTRPLSRPSTCTLEDGRITRGKPNITLHEQVHWIRQSKIRRVFVLNKFLKSCVENKADSLPHSSWQSS